MPVEQWFSTPVYYDYVSNVDAVNNELFDAYNKLSFGKNDFWGNTTHSVSDPKFDSNFIEDMSLDKFKEEIHAHVKKYMAQLNSDCTFDFKIRSSWFTQTKPGEYTRIHNHGYSDISGAYYLKTNGRDGSLTFMAPTPSLSSTVFAKLGDSVTYRPEVGKLILFPGWLYHTVNENDTEDNRISVSFNIYFDR